MNRFLFLVISLAALLGVNAAKHNSHVYALVVFQMDKHYLTLRHSLEALHRLEIPSDNILVILHAEQESLIDQAKPVLTSYGVEPSIIWWVLRLPTLDALLGPLILFVFRVQG